MPILWRDGNRFHVLRGDERLKDDVIVGEVVCRTLALEIVFEVEEDADHGLLLGADLCVADNQPCPPLPEGVSVRTVHPGLDAVFPDHPLVIAVLVIGVQRPTQPRHVADAMLLGTPGNVPNASQVFAAVSGHNYVKSGIAYLPDIFIFHSPGFAVWTLLHEDFVYQHSELVGTTELPRRWHVALFAQSQTSPRQQEQASAGCAVVLHG